MRRDEEGEMKEVGSITEHIQSILKSIINTTILKRALEITILALFLAVLLINSRNTKSLKDIVIPVQNIKMSNRMPEHYEVLDTISIDEMQEEIRNEIFYGELEQVAILVQAEAGNQDELGKRYVADVVLNRLDDKDFPDTIEEVLKQDRQFACILDGNYNKAEWSVTEDCFDIVLEEYESRKDHTIIYFRTDRYSDSGHPAYKYGDHYFSTK